MIHAELDSQTTESHPQWETLYDSEQVWSAASARLLAAIPAEQRESVERLIEDRHSGGVGLREWISLVARGASVLPASVPAALVEVYLCDPEALPQHDCEGCGLAVPVRPDRRYGSEAEPEQTYFGQCPVCGCETGQYRYWSRQLELRRKRPR